MWHSRGRHAPDPLWVPVAAPIIWSSHFTVCYIWAAMACGRFAPRIAGTLDVTLLALTAIALVAIGTLFLRGFRQLDYRLPVRPSDDGTPEARNTFMSYMTMLLAGMSWIGTLFVGVAGFAVGGCS